MGLSDGREPGQMTIQLTEMQSEALHRESVSPVAVLDPNTNALWYLIPAADYQTVQDILEDERQQKAFRTVGLGNAAGRLNAAE